MVYGLYKCIAGITAHDIANCGAFQLPVGVTISAFELVGIDAKHAIQKYWLNSLILICGADTASKEFMLVSMSHEMRTS